MNKVVLLRKDHLSNRYDRYKCVLRYFHLRNLLFENYPFYNLQNPSFLCKVVHFDILYRDIHFHIGRKSEDLGNMIHRCSKDNSVNL